MQRIECPSESSGLCQFVGTWKLYLLCTSCSRHQWTATHTIERIDKTGIAVRKPHCRDWNWKDAKIDKRGSIMVQWKEDQVFCRSTQTFLSKKIGVYICIKDLNPSSRHEHKGFEIGGDILREFGRCRSREQSNSSLAKMDDNKKSYLDSWLLFFPQLADMGVSFQGGGGAPHCLVKKIEAFPSFFIARGSLAAAYTYRQQNSIRICYPAQNPIANSPMGKTTQ